jgi:hypothetical protein
MFQNRVSEKIKTQISCPETFFPENLALFEVMWKNMVETDRPHMTVLYDACALHAG